MSRVAYVNGRFTRHAEAAVHIEDRGYQFADGVYEIWAVFDGRLADSAGHFERLTRSLCALRITMPLSHAVLDLILRETIRRNHVRNGMVYLQITRGVAPRDHPFPAGTIRPSVVMTAKSVDMVKNDERAAKGVKVITVPETRWSRCDIKSIGLLPNVLAKQAAREAEATEAWFVDELGFVTEGASSNAWIVDAHGVLRTRDTQANILRGVTRQSVLAIAASLGLVFEERAFTVDEAKQAREAFVTGAGSLVLPVTRIDATILSGGVPGPVAKRLRDVYIQKARVNVA